VLVPYSNVQLVERPFGLTLPFSRADVGAIDDAEPVATDGAAVVENVRSAPCVVPASLVATRR
jgi:hypothetical protein